MTRQSSRRSCTPRVRPLEARRLLAASASYAGLGSLDVAGPTAAIGPGGFRNLHLQVTVPLGGAGAATLKYLNVAGPDGFAWTYGTPGSGSGNPRANAAIAVAAGRVATDGASETFDAYLSPVIAAVDPATGATTTRTLANGQSLALTVAYAAGGGPVTTETAAANPALVVTPRDLDQPLADPPPAMPSVAVGAFSGTYVGQSADGLAHIRVAGLPAGARVVPGTAELSDVAGIYWDAGTAYGRPELGMTISQPAGTGTTADIAFPPRRDEAGSTMTFRFQLDQVPGRWFVVDVPIGPTQHTDPDLRDGGPIDPDAMPFVVSPTAIANLVSYRDPSGAQQVGDIQDVLDAGHEVVVLSAGTYRISKPLDINAGMILRGADPSVELDFAGLPSSIPRGIFNLNASHITLSQFRVRFLDARVNFAGPHPAIIVNQDVDQRPRVDLNILGLDIRSPATAAGVDPDNGMVLAVATTFFDTFNSGTIRGNTVYGGTIEVQGGPWTIADNRVLGAVPGTLSLGAFAARGAHDVALTSNLVTNPDPAANGQIDRLFVSRGSGYNFALTGNVSGSNIGVLAAVPDGSPSAPVDPRNNREVILFEDFGKIFEGNVAALGVSSSAAAGDDRRVISIPKRELALFSGYYWAGRWAVTVLNGPAAGTHVSVIQAFPGDTDPDTASFLLDSPLPTGSYDLDIAPAYSKVVIAGNSIDTRGTVSTGLVLGTTMVDATVTGNTFLGDRSAEYDGNGNYHESQAIRFNPYKASLSRDYLHAGGEYDSYNVLDVDIAGNTVVDAVGGIKAYLEINGTLSTTAGRTYGFLDLRDNQFRYSYRNPQIIALGNVGDYAGLINSSGVVYDAAATHFADPNTIRVAAAGNGVEWTGGAAPAATDTVVNAASVNGTLYGADVALTLLASGTTATTFDFGPADQTVAAGATAVSERTTYTLARGYGWVDDSGDRNSLDRHAGDPLTTDAVYASAMTFQVDLPDGDYDVIPTLGDLGPFAHSAVVTLQGAVVATVATAARQTKSPTYRATVTDGRLRLTLRSSPSGAGSDGFAVIEGLAIVARPAATTPAAGDLGFESVRVGTGFAYNPAGSAWTFAGSAGVSGNGSAFTGGNPGAPEGSQVGVLQGTATISQAVTLAAGAYQVTLRAAQRAAGTHFNAGGQDFQVVVDGTVVGSIKPTGTAYGAYAAGAFALAAGRHTIAFVGLNSAGGDNTAFLDAVSIGPAGPAASDLGFESVAVGGGFSYNPAGSAWTFAGSAGVSGDGSAFTAATGTAPEGRQIAFLQQRGSISQAVAFATAGTYRVTFRAAQRAGYGIEDFQVRVDGVAVGTFTPVGSSYSAHSTASFTVTAGAHAITFLGLNSAGGDTTAFLDDVAITAATPTPSASARAATPSSPVVVPSSGVAEPVPSGAATIGRATPRGPASSAVSSRRRPSPPGQGPARPVEADPGRAGVA